MSTEHLPDGPPAADPPDLAWPPPDADIDDIQMIDLGAPLADMALPPAHGAYCAGGAELPAGTDHDRDAESHALQDAAYRASMDAQLLKSQSLILEPPSLPRPLVIASESTLPVLPPNPAIKYAEASSRRRALEPIRYWRGLWTLGLGLLLLNRTEFLPKNTALPEPATTWTTEQQATLINGMNFPGSVWLGAANPSTEIERAVPPPQPGAGKATVEARAAAPPQMRAVGSRRGTRREATGPTTQKRRQPVTSLARTTPPPDERPAWAETPMSAEHVAPRPIDVSRPRLVPAPFPSPRGARTSLELVIDEGGRVASARIASSGAAYYDAPLLAKARTWRFEPGRIAGRPARTTFKMDVPISR